MDSPRPEEGLGQRALLLSGLTSHTAHSPCVLGDWTRATTVVYRFRDTTVTAGSYRPGLDKKAGPEAKVAHSPEHRKTSS